MIRHREHERVGGDSPRLGRLAVIVRRVPKIRGNSGIGRLINGLRPGDRKGGSGGDRKSTRLNSSHGYISYAVFCLKKKKDSTLKHSGQHAFGLDLVHVTRHSFT